jgi:hypothetical protein
VPFGYLLNAARRRHAAAPWATAYAPESFQVATEYSNGSNMCEENFNVENWDFQPMPAIKFRFRY